MWGQGRAQGSQKKDHFEKQKKGGSIFRTEMTNKDSHQWIGFSKEKWDQETKRTERRSDGKSPDRGGIPVQAPF